MKNQTLSIERMRHLKDLGVGTSNASMRCSFCCFNTECFSNIFASSLIGYRNTTLGRLLLGDGTEQVLPIKDIQYKT